MFEKARQSHPIKTDPPGGGSRAFPSSFNAIRLGDAGKSGPKAPRFDSVPAKVETQNSPSDMLGIVLAACWRLGRLQVAR
jgi:hypothetical protein